MLNNMLITYNIPRKEDLPKIPKPFVHRVVVMPLQYKEKTAGGIILPGQTIDEKGWSQCLAVIVSIGDGAFKNSEGEYVYDPVPQIGDVVMYGKFAGRKFCKEEVNAEGKVEKLIMTLIEDSDIAMTFPEPTGYRTDV